MKARTSCFRAFPARPEKCPSEPIPGKDTAFLSAGSFADANLEDLVLIPGHPLEGMKGFRELRRTVHGSLLAERGGDNLCNKCPKCNKIASSVPEAFITTTKSREIHW